MRRYFNPPDANIDPRIEKWVVDKALSAGAIAPIMYVGAGATSITILDSQNLAFKVPRDGWELFVQDEAEFFKEASRVSDISNHTARFVGYRNGVLIKEYVDGLARENWARVSGAVMDKMRIVHNHICSVMSKRGFSCPEFTAGSYVTHRSRGLVLVDATFAGPIGRRLLPNIVHAARTGSESPMSILSKIGRMYDEGFLSREAAKYLVTTVIQNQPFEDVDRYVPYLLAELDKPLSSRAWGPFAQRRSNPYHNRRRNSLDNEIRRLERAYRADSSDLVAYEALLAARIRVGIPVDDPRTLPSSVEAEALLLNARVRSKVTTQTRVVMAARIGHPAARLAAPEWAKLGEIEFSGTAIYALSGTAIYAIPSRREIVSFACDCVERALPVFEQARPGDTRPRRAVESIRECIASPTQETVSIANAARSAVLDASGDSSYGVDIGTGDFAASDVAYAVYSVCLAIIASNSSIGAFRANDAANRIVSAAVYDSFPSDCETERYWQIDRLIQYLIGEAP